MLLELFEQIINEPCFDILRTKEQLGLCLAVLIKQCLQRCVCWFPGYIVYSSVKNVSGVLGLQVLVQSNRSPDYVDTRIENFLLEMDVCAQPV